MKRIADFIGTHVQRVMGDASPSPADLFDRAVGTVPDDTTLKALRRIRVPPGYFTLPEYLNTHGRADWQGIHPKIALFSAKYVEALRRLHVPVYVHCAYRTPALQNELYESGNSTLQGLDAPHPRGCAVDVVHAQYHWDLTRQEWNILGHIGKNVAAQIGMPFDTKKPQLRWGGDWSFWDPAHWDLAAWRDVPPPPLGESVRMSPRLLKHHYR